MQEEFDCTFCLGSLDVINPTGQIFHSGPLCLHFRMGIFLLMAIYFSPSAGPLESGALCLITAYGVTADGISSMLPNVRWQPS